MATVRIARPYYRVHIICNRRYRLINVCFLFLLYCILWFISFTFRFTLVLYFFSPGSIISTVTLSATGFVVMFVISDSSCGDCRCEWCWCWRCDDPCRSWWAPPETLPGATELLRFERTEVAEALLALPRDSDWEPAEGTHIERGLNTFAKPCYVPRAAARNAARAQAQ